MIKVCKKKEVMTMEKDNYRDGKHIASTNKSKEILYDLNNGVFLKLLVLESVYPPREDSKMLVDCINNLNYQKGKAVEIGCGTGLASIILAKNGWKVDAFDINPYAVISTVENISRASVEHSITVNEGGLGEKDFNISEDTELIVWNLPYLTPPQDNEPRLEWIEEASMSDLNGEGWGHHLADLLEDKIHSLDPKLLVLLLQRKYPKSPSTTEYWANLGWSHRVLSSKWLYNEKLEVVAYWRPGVGTEPKKLQVCVSTMDEAKKLPIEGWQRVTTRSQTNGRGRRKSAWESKNEDLLATWSIRKTLLKELQPGLIQILIGAKISKIINQYCKWPNDIVDEKGEKIGGILIEMDTESENLRVGIGINQSSNKIGNLKIGGWRESIPELTLENLFSRIDAKLSTLFEDHPLLKTKLKTEEMKSESWRSLTKLLSRGYTLGSDHGSSRVIKLNTNGELSIFSNESKENIHNLDSLRWSFNP
jgi:biotin-(acetyl-CoA carboxylase) ligase/methylase of polypeptide subunit release factors